MKCTRCNLYTEARGSVSIIKDKNPDVLLLIDYRNIKSDNIKSYLHLIRSSVGILNPILCVLNKAPNKKELDKCFLNIWSEISKANPKLVVVLDELSLYQVTGKKDYNMSLGKFFISKKIGRNIYVPEISAKGFKQIDLLVDNVPKEIYHYKYKYIDTVEKFDHIYPILLGSDKLYFDSETTDLDPLVGEFTLLQLGIGTEPIYLLDPKILGKVRDKLKVLFTTKKNLL